MRYLFLIACALVCVGLYADDCWKENGNWFKKDGEITYKFYPTEKDDEVELGIIDFGANTTVSEVVISSPIELCGKEYVIKTVGAWTRSGSTYPYLGGYTPPINVNLIIENVDSIVSIFGNFCEIITLRGVRRCSSRAFMGSEDLRRIDWGDCERYRDIDNNAFHDTKLEEYDFTGVDSIGRNAFEGTLLESADLRSVKKIGAQAFKDTPLKGEADLSNLTYLGREAFMNTRLESVELPDSLEYLGSGAFKGSRLKSIDLHRTVVDSLNADVVRENPDCRSFVAENLMYLPAGAFYGTSINRLENHPHLKVAIDPHHLLDFYDKDNKYISDDGVSHFEKIDVPSLEHLELRYAFVDTLVVGKNIKDETLSELSGGLSDDIRILPGLQLGQSWVGHVIVDEENKDFGLDAENRLCRKRFNGSVITFPMKYYREVKATGKVHLGSYGIYGETEVPDYDYITKYVTTVTPKISSSRYITSEHIPGGTVICDAIDTIYVDSPITDLRYIMNGWVYYEDSLYYRLHTFKVTAPRGGNPVKVLIHPGEARYNSSDKVGVMFGWAKSKPMYIGHHNGTEERYGYWTRSIEKESFEVITIDNDPEGLIDRWLSAGLESVEGDGGLTVRTDGLHLELGSMEFGARWSVVSMTGRTVSTGVAATDGIATAQLPAPGIYIVRCGATTLKVAAR